METTLEHLHKDLVTVKNDIQLIKNILAEEGELTVWAKKELEKARQTPENEYVKLDDPDV